MPELPDVTVYVEQIARRTVGETLEKVRLGSPFVLRSVSPRLSEVEGRRVSGVERLGKRIVIRLEDGLALVIHLMIAGRLQWHDVSDRPKLTPGRGAKNRLAAFDFTSGTLLLTEAGSKKRASLHVARGALDEHDRGGLEPVGSKLEAFTERLRGENHTLKRSLTDPRLFSGIGNAYSDEILYRARLSPLQWTKHLDAEQVEALWCATREVLEEWIERLRAEAGDGFPKKVTAFRAEMAVHGRFAKPCPRCGSLVQRIVYAENECNYCATCQTGGKLLKDRALSQLLRGDWPRSLQELEEQRAERGAGLPGTVPEPATLRKVKHRRGPRGSR
ncbi:MAG TPA: DNA-formamidopyrimidine glycosylase family protein [Thermoanaerobaculia bacterium]|nr:DNA-formamidopyrimidine glycosylase family protein [Thermoanaerobaculia bacterium]